MKLIACLTILSLIFNFWSNIFVGSTASETPEGNVVLEQFFDRPLVLWPKDRGLRMALQRDHSPEQSRWAWDVWSEWLCQPHRRRRKWRKLYRLLRKIRCWHRQRVRRWRLLRQEWQELMTGTSSVESSAGDAPSSSPEQGACPTAVPSVSKRAMPSAATDQVAEKSSPSAKRGP